MKFNLGDTSHLPKKHEGESVNKWIGSFTEIEDGFDLSEFDFDLSRVIVRDDAIAMEWTEDDDEFGTTLRRVKSGEDEVWIGEMTARNRPGESGEIQAKRFDCRNGDILLLAKWSFSSWSGQGVFELELD